MRAHSASAARSPKRRELDAGTLNTGFFGATTQVGPNPGWANLGTGNSGFGQNTTRPVRATQVSRTWVSITRVTLPAIPDIWEIQVRSRRASVTAGYYNAAVGDAGIFIAGVMSS
jgi:hypothetical protein